MSSPPPETKPFLGITPPIDERPPTRLDTQSTEALRSCLEGLGVFESESGRRVRQGVIDELSRVAKAWCAEEWRGDGQAPRCELRTFGSVKLDVHTPDADIDVVLIAPKHCTREAFFGSLVAKLEARATIGSGRVMPVRDAYTPVVKLRVGETDVDLLFVALDALELPDPLDVLDDGLLRGLDEGAIRSLNGVRVAEMLLKLVPDVDTFRLALRAVKRWARSKGLYSNVLGLLGGVNCAILVAFVCQRYPLAAASTVVGRFFRIFDSWDWPNPVFIAPPAVNVEHAYVAWNPRLNPRDRAHLAPIVTPAHPTMNSSYNIGEPQLRAIRDELKIGVDATRRIARIANDIDDDETRTRALQDAWGDLFAASDFFTSYRHYVQVDVSAGDDDTLRRWFAWCESRLRGLVIALDSPGFFRSRPHATPIERRDPLSDRKTRSFFVALAFEGHVQHIDLTPCVRDFSARVNAWEHRTQDMDLELKHAQQHDLPDWATNPDDAPSSAVPPPESVVDMAHLAEDDQETRLADDIDDNRNDEDDDDDNDDRHDDNRHDEDDGLFPNRQSEAPTPPPEERPDDDSSSSDARRRQREHSEQSSAVPTSDDDPPRPATSPTSSPAKKPRSEKPSQMSYAQALLTSNKRS